MKKYFILILFLAAALAGCRNLDVDLIDGRPASDTRPKDSLCTLTVQAFRGEGPLTKGLEIGEDTDEATTTALKSIWKEGEKVYVFLGRDYLGTLTVTPASVTITKGQTATFTVVATGTGLTYQWYYQKPGETTWNACSNNGTSATYSVVAAARHNGYSYRCKVTDSGDGSVYTSAATLTVK